MDKFSSENHFEHSSYIPCTHKYLSGPMLAMLKGVGARRVLDIGCGNGIMAQFLIGNGIEVVGIDPGDESINNFRRLLPEAKSYQTGIYDDPAVIEETDFDAVISTEVIEHLFFPGELLRFAKAKLRPGGYMIVSTPYHGYVKNIALSLANKWDFHHSSLWDGGHIKFFSRQALGQLFNDEGFNVTGFKGCGRLPYLWKSMIMMGQIKG